MQPIANKEPKFNHIALARITRGYFAAEENAPAPANHPTQMAKDREVPGDGTVVLGNSGQIGGGEIPVVRFTTGSQAGKTVRLENGTLTLGRGSENDLVVDDRGVSRLHLKLIVQGSRVHLYDQNSTNGTQVGSKRVEQATLEDGDLILVGTNVKMRFLLLAPEEKEIEQKLYEGAHQDALTNVANRRSWMQQAEKALITSGQRNRPLSVAICDLDHFKQVNDKYGHAAGDAVLIEFCRRTRGLGRDVLVGRLGGEEFAIVLPGFDAERAFARMQRLRGEVESPHFAIFTETSIPVTVSIGLVTVNHPGGARLDELMKRADAALYAAKEDGRNRVNCATAEAKKAAVEEETASLKLKQKRRNTRTPCEGDIYLAWQGQDLVAEICDIGIGGLSVKLKTALPLGEVVEIRSPFHQESMVRAAIKWTQQGRVGLSFTDSPSDLRNSWVNQVLKDLGLTAQTARERRNHSRIPVSLPMTLQAPVGTYSATVVNLGLGGVCVKSALAPPLGLTGTVQLGELKVHARVVWVSAPLYGLKFAPLGKSQVAYIQRVVEA